MRRLIDLTQLAPEGPRLINRDEYNRMGELGFFEDERVELLRGIIVKMSPQSVPHANVIERSRILGLPFERANIARGT